MEYYITSLSGIENAVRSFIHYKTITQLQTVCNINRLMRWEIMSVQTTILNNIKNMTTVKVAIL